MKRHLIAASLLALAGTAAQAQSLQMPILKFPTSWPTSIVVAPTPQVPASQED